MRRSTPPATWSAATRATGPACRRCCSARTSTPCATPASMTAISASIAAIEAVAALHARGERLPFAIEVIAFGDEEGVRFPASSPARARSPARSTRRLWTSSDAAGRQHARGAARLRLRPRRDPGRRPADARRCWAMSSCTSSRGRCWRPRSCRSASSPRSAGASRFTHRGHGRGRPCRHRADGAAQGRAAPPRPR